MEPLSRRTGAPDTDQFKRLVDDIATFEECSPAEAAAMLTRALAGPVEPLQSRMPDPHPHNPLAVAVVLAAFMVIVIGVALVLVESIRQGVFW